MAEIAVDVAAAPDDVEWFLLHRNVSFNRFTRAVPPLRLRTEKRLCSLSLLATRMATKLALDPELIERAFEFSGERTRKAAVTLALQEFVARRSQKRLVELMGKLEWITAFDYKA